MNTDDILYVLKGRLGRNIIFHGVLSSDQVRSFEIPKIRDNNIAFIANILRLGDLRMGHWVVFLITKSPTNEIYFFDSYALKPAFYCGDFEFFLKRNSIYEAYNITRKLQSDASLICGLYASWYIYHCSRHSIYRVTQILGKTFKDRSGYENDKIVFNFYINRLNKKSCLYWKRIDRSLVTYKQCIDNL